MATLGAQVINRLENLEASLTNTDLQLASEISAIKKAFATELAEVKKLIEGTDGRSMPTSGGARSLYNSKEFLPPILGNGYKEAWRNWAYKAKDWASQYDASLPAKLEAIESMTTELTPDYIASQGVSEATDLELRRFLVHRLEGDPAEMVRTAKSKPGLEQYRILAQFCDPTAGGGAELDRCATALSSSARAVPAVAHGSHCCLGDLGDSVQGAKW